MNRPVPVRILWALVAVFAAISVSLVAFYFINASGDAERATKENQQLIQELQDQLVVQNADAEAATKTEADKVECVTRFTYAIQAASSEVLVTLGDLVIVIATTVPGPEREAAIGDGVILVDEAVTLYRQTVQARSAFDLKGSPLPCPLKPGLSG